jgi:ribosomal protein L28
MVKKCSVCWEEEIEGNRIVKSKFGHVVCEKCLEKIKDKSFTNLVKHWCYSADNNFVNKLKSFGKFEAWQQQILAESKDNYGLTNYNLNEIYI